MGVRGGGGRRPPGRAGAGRAGGCGRKLRGGFGKRLKKKLKGKEKKTPNKNSHPKPKTTPPTQPPTTYRGPCSPPPLPAPGPAPKLAKSEGKRRAAWPRGSPVAAGALRHRPMAPAPRAREAKRADIGRAPPSPPAPSFYPPARGGVKQTQIK